MMMVKYFSQRVIIFNACLGFSSVPHLSLQIRKQCFTCHNYMNIIKYYSMFWHQTMCTDFFDPYVNISVKNI